jgi:hypothetical protein
MLAAAGRGAVRTSSSDVGCPDRRRSDDRRPWPDARAQNFLPVMPNARVVVIQH